MSKTTPKGDNKSERENSPATEESLLSWLREQERTGNEEGGRLRREIAHELSAALHFVGDTMPGSELADFIGGIKAKADGLAQQEEVARLAANARIARVLRSALDLVAPPAPKPSKPAVASSAAKGAGAKRSGSRSGAKTLAPSAAATTPSAAPPAPLTRSAKGQFLKSLPGAALSRGPAKAATKAGPAPSEGAAASRVGDGLTVGPDGLAGLDGLLIPAEGGGAGSLVDVDGPPPAADGALLAACVEAAPAGGSFDPGWRDLLTQNGLAEVGVMPPHEADVSVDVPLSPATSALAAMSSTILGGAPILPSEKRLVRSAMPLIRLAIDGAQEGGNKRKGARKPWTTEYERLSRLHNLVCGFEAFCEEVAQAYWEESGVVPQRAEHDVFDPDSFRPKA